MRSPSSRDYARLCYDFNEGATNRTRLQRELGFDLIGLSAPMRIATNAYKT